MGSMLSDFLVLSQKKLSFDVKSPNLQTLTNKLEFKKILSRQRQTG